MDGGSREAVSSSGQLEDWAAGVAADLNEDNRGEDNSSDRRQAGDRDVTSPAGERSGNNHASAAAKRSRQPQQEREDSPDGPRPKLPRPEKKETCPRCSSLDTKFCYYNNYNIKQPRFYCKTCQRYWTAGGTLRNIAPGSGRRKSKSKAVGREQRDSPSLADQLTAAQTNMFGLPVNAPTSYNGLNPALLADPSSILANGASASSAYAHQQLPGGHGGLAGLKLAGVSQLHHGQWNGGSALAEELHANAALRALAAECGEPPMASGHGHGHGQQLSGVDARVLLNGHGHGDDVPAGLALGQQASAHQHQHHGDRGQHQGQSSPPGSPPPHQQQQASSPHQPNSQLSQQPSPPQQPHQGAGSDDPDADGVAEGAEAVVQGRRIRRKAELLDGPRSTGYILGGGSLAVLGGAGAGVGGGGALSGSQLSGLNLPPSMASLAAVMGPGGGPSNLGGGLHPLLCSQEAGGPGGLLDGPQSGLSRHNLQLALQQHQLAAVQQHESLQQLNGLLPHSSVSLHAPYQLLHGLGGHQGGNPSVAASSTAAAVAALDPLQRSALLQQAAGLGGVGWLQGGGGGNMLPSSLLLQQSSALGAPSNSSAAAEWISLAAAAAAACPKVHAPAATHASVNGGGTGGIAAQMLQAQAAAFAAGGGCGGGVGWPSSGSFAGVPGGPSSWSLWSSYNSPASGNYAGYALQAAAAAYSGGR